MSIRPALPYLTICLNPVIQRTVGFTSLRKGEVNRSSSWRVDAAGKGVCCARVLGQTGRASAHLTALGGPAREWFLSLCAQDGVRVEWVESGSNPRFCTTVLDLSDGTATELIEESLPVAPGTADSLMERYGLLLPEVSAVLITGTKAPGYPQDILYRMAMLARENDIPLSLDLKGADLVSCLRAGPITAKPNLEELLHTFGEEPGSRAAAAGREDAVRELVARVGARWYDSYGTFLVVTRGAMSTLYWDGSSLQEAPAESISPVNPIGSGDAFHAGLAASLVEGSGIDEAVREGTRLGARNAQTAKPGSILNDDRLTD